MKNLLFFSLVRGIKIHEHEHYPKHNGSKIFFKFHTKLGKYFITSWFQQIFSKFDNFQTAYFIKEFELKFYTEVMKNFSSIFFDKMVNKKASWKSLTYMDWKTWKKSHEILGKKGFLMQFHKKSTPLYIIYAHVVWWPY